jgi:hypothetical protein
LGVVTAAASFVVVFFIVRARLAKAKPLLSALSGAFLGVLVLAVTTLFHSAVSPGAYGWPLSFIGQFAAALVLVGWLALFSGAILGRHIGRAAASRDT